MRPAALGIYLGAAMEDEISREYMANMLYLIATAMGMDKGAKRLGEILRADEDDRDDRTGGEILDDVKDKLIQRLERRRGTDAGGN